MKKIYSHCLLPIIVFLLINFQLLAAQTVSTQVDRSIVALGSTFNLIIKYDSQQTNAQPDLTPLQQDFTVMGQSTRREVRIVNGVTTVTSNWIITLAPNKVGEFTIPALSIGPLTSEAVTIEVVEPNQLPASDQENEIFMEVEATPDNPYVQSQIFYTVKLLYAKNIFNATLTEPRVDDALITQLGEDKSYETMYNNRLYRVIERRYVIFPQQSGSLTITSPIFTGKTGIANQQQSPFEPLFGRTSGQPVRVSSETLELNVRPKPANIDLSWWLPAQAVTLEQTWSADTFRVGEPITRTITLDVQGVSGEQLPTLDTGHLDFANNYPDKPVINTTTDGQNILGQRIQKYALIPNQQGEFAIPEIKVNWWDTKTEQLKTAVLPAQTIEILPAQATTSAPAPITLQPESITTSSPTLIDLQPQPKSETNLWKYLAVLFVILWALTLTTWLYSQQRRSNKIEKSNNLAEKSHQQSIGQAKKAIHRACLDKDARQTKKAILAWAQLTWTDNYPLSLGQLAELLTEANAKKVIKALDEHLYNTNNSVWDSTSFWKNVEPSLVKTNQGASDSKNEQLEPLYPKYKLLLKTG